MLKFECPNCQHVFIEKDVKPYNKGHFGGIWLCPNCQTKLDPRNKNAVMRPFQNMLYCVIFMQPINILNVNLKDSAYAWVKPYLLTIILGLFAYSMWQITKWWPISRKIKRGEIIVKLDKWQDS